ncbi:MAG: virulence RhuM family protein [Simkaniaceae bacterium]
MDRGEVILYTTADGQTSIQLRIENGNVWLTQLELAELFQTTKQNISLHIKNILEEGEIDNSVVKEDLTTASDGKRYQTKFYNLSMILSVGYRVISHRGTQFRQWATAHLQEYLIKGFVMDDARLKEPKPWDYFDEWLERIREIRASEKRFYQKVRDIYATAVDYNPKSEEAQLFFKKVQNKMLWAATHHTASELIVERADIQKPNMGLKSWKGGRVRQQDVTVAKNYLDKPEIEELNQIVVMYLDYAENQAKNRKTVTMAVWEQKLDAFLTFNEKDLLGHAGKVPAKVAEQFALERYEEFDKKRRQEEKQVVDAEDMALFESLKEKAKQLESHQVDGSKFS